MSPTGKRRHSASAAAVLPAAVGPIRNTAGGSCPPGLLATQKKAVQSLHVKLYPGGPAVIALVGAFGALHVAQQGVHFINIEAPVGPDRAVAGDGRQKFVKQGVGTTAV